MFELFINCFKKKYFCLQGRASRREYISFRLFYFSLELIMKTLMTVFNNSTLSILVSFLCFGFFIYATVPSITVAVRRFHDFNLNGYLGVVDIPILIILYLKGYSTTALIVSLIISLLLISIKGTPGPNKYGEPPIN